MRYRQNTKGDILYGPPVRHVTIPIRYWGIGIGIRGTGRYWYWYSCTYSSNAPIQSRSFHHAKH